MFEIFGSVFHIAQQWQNITDKAIQPRIGMTVKQWLLIAVLEKIFPDYPPTINQAAEAYGTSRQNIMRMALDLQKNRFAIVANDPLDKRIQRIVITGKHKMLFENSNSIEWQEKTIKNLFVGLEETEIDLFHAITKKLIGRINEIKK